MASSKLTLRARDSYPLRDHMMGELVSAEAFTRRVDKAGLRREVQAVMDGAPGTTEFGALAAVLLEKGADYNSMYTIPLPEIAGTGIGYASDYEDRAYTLRAGLANVRLIDRFWRKHRTPKGQYRVIDFGCGTGRLLRYVCEFGQNVEPIGCEVNPKAVAWLQKAFPCEIHLIDAPYDLSFLNAPADLIYAWSIFTHFSEDEHFRWLETITDKLSPGGLFIATFKSPAMLERASTDDAYRKRSLIADGQLPGLLKQADESGFVFFECYDQDKSAQHGIDAIRFGQTYISHDYIRENWSRYGEVVEIGVAVPDWQDFAIIKVR